MGLLLPGVVVIGLLLYIGSVYNTFQTTDTRIEAALQEIGNQLKRQASLIPNLEASVKGYLTHEKDIYASITNARKAVDSAVSDKSGKSLDKVEEAINGMAGKLSVMVESNPEIKGNTVVTDLMAELRDTADKLMYARRSVIDLSQQYNQMRVTFPSNLIATAFNFQKKVGIATPMTGAHVEVSESETKNVEIKL